MTRGAKTGGSTTVAPLRLGLVAALGVIALAAAPAVAHDDGGDGSGKGDLTTGGNGGPQGGPFPSTNIDLLGHLPLSMIGGSNPVVGSGGVRGSDIWGWTDALTGREYALVGRSDGTAFVDITDPVNPLYLGILPSATGNAAWRDIKTYQDHAYIVSDINGPHGLQIFDLTTLRNPGPTPVQFTETAHVVGFGRAHNIAINEATGWAYVVGSNKQNGGLYFLDLSDPLNPVNPAGGRGYADDGYTHDAQVVVYDGPDTAHIGREIAFAYNTDSLTIVDVEDKSAPVQLSRTGYVDMEYVHQGWLTEDHRYILQNDELDESELAHVTATRTHVWDVADLDSPIYVGFYEAPVGSVDHNLYTRDGYAYLSNYTTGLRVVDLSGVGTAALNEVAHIDTHPATDSLESFDGVWSTYPYLASGAIANGDRNEGLVIVHLKILPGDTQTDHRVDLVDMTTLSNHWMTAVDAGYMEADFNHDQFVDDLDLDLMEANWDELVAGMTFDEALSVVGLPEPHVSLGCLLFLVVRRRSRVFRV